MVRDDELLRRPLVIFVFDEAHILTDNPLITNRTMKWNVFGISPTRLSRRSFFRRRGALISSPRRYVPTPREDPITEIRFDDLAYDAPEYKIM